MSNFTYKQAALILVLVAVVTLSLSFFVFSKMFDKTRTSSGDPDFRHHLVEQDRQYDRARVVKKEKAPAEPLTKGEWIEYRSHSFSDYGGAPLEIIRLYRSGEVEIKIMSPSMTSSREMKVLKEETSSIHRERANRMIDEFKAFPLEEYYSEYHSGMLGGGEEIFSWGFVNSHGSIRAVNIGVIPVVRAGQLLIPIRDAVLKHRTIPDELPNARPVDRPVPDRSGT